MATNLEVKIRCSDNDLERVRQAALAAGSEPFSRLSHSDTYFTVPAGRLKLREITSSTGETSAELIGYHRPDASGARWSDYQRATVPTDSVQALLGALSLTLGVATIVEKRRDVAIWNRTRIHLDNVDRLGCFIELETVAEEPNDPTALSEMEELVSLLGLARLEHVAGSYGEMEQA